MVFTTPDLFSSANNCFAILQPEYGDVIESGIPERLQIFSQSKRLILIGGFQLIEKLACGSRIAKARIVRSAAPDESVNSDLLNAVLDDPAFAPEDVGIDEPTFRLQERKRLPD